MDPADRSSQSDQDIIPQHTQVTNKLTPVQQAEEEILRILIDEEKVRGHTKILSEDVEFRLEEVLDDLRDEDQNNFQQVITLRMRELAYNKILVMTYEKSYFRLVQALHHIAREYMRFECYQQAVGHFDNAIAKHVQAEENTTHKLYHSFLLSGLGQCLYKQNRFEQAQSWLDKAICLQKEYEESEKKEIDNIKTLCLMAQALAELNKSSTSLSVIDQAISKAEKILGERSRTYGRALKDKADILRGNPSSKSQMTECFVKAIEAIKMSNESGSEEDLISIYRVLIDEYEQEGKEGIHWLRECYQLFQDTYGNADKKSIKQQRSLATGLLKHKFIEEALEQLDDILEKEQKVYGENSLQVGKQHKTIAGVESARGQAKAAEAHYKKALKIFHDLGEQRLVREVKVKMSAIQPSLS